MQHQADISETVFFRQYPEILETLLKDHTTQQNIFWATDSYAGLGQGFQYLDPITTAHIIGEHGMVIRPRALKTRGEQIGRTKDMAEVFTPSWYAMHKTTWWMTHGLDTKDHSILRTILPNRGKLPEHLSLFLRARHGKTMFVPPEWKSPVGKLLIW